MKVSALIVFLLAACFQYQAFANDQFNCQYQIEYKTYPNKELEINQALVQRLKSCAGKMPCGDSKKQFEVDLGKTPILVKHKESVSSQKDCENVARKSCGIARAGVSKEKKVTMSFNSIPVKEYICREGQEIEEKSIEGNQENTVQPPTSRPSEKNKGAR